MALRTRISSRQPGGQPLVTTYDYDDDTGELTAIDYSDATPDVTFAYGRLGRLEQATDAAGTHTFAYNDALQWESETLSAGLHDKRITREYEDGAGVPGRFAGVKVGTTAQPDADYQAGFFYDAVGRPDRAARLQE